MTLGGVAAAGDAVEGGSGAASEGQPGGAIHYREYKLLLRSDCFREPESFREYWTKLCEVARQVGVRVTTNEAGFKPRMRRVLFFDTENFDLYSNAFILRERTLYEDGWPAKEQELTLKFRHHSYERAASIDMRPRLAGKATVKFKEEVLPLKTHLGGLRSLFSNGCVIVSPVVTLTHWLDDIVSVFPALGALPVPPRTRLDLVNNVTVEEVLVEAGAFHFHHGFDAKATIAVWRDRASDAALVGEFSFHAKFRSLDAVHEGAKRLSERFFAAVQLGAPRWVQLGTTKTAMVYGLGAAAPPGHE